MVLISDKEVTMEVGSLTFTNDAVWKRYMFTETFYSAPFVTAISVDSSESGNADVNVFVKAVTSTYVDLEVSQIFAGTIHFHAIRISS